jgi:hypothetical protein
LKNAPDPSRVPVPFLVPWVTLSWKTVEMKAMRSNEDHQKKELKELQRRPLSVFARFRHMIRRLNLFFRECGVMAGQSHCVHCELADKKVDVAGDPHGRGRSGH